MVVGSGFGLRFRPRLGLGGRGDGTGHLFLHLLLQPLDVVAEGVGPGEHGPAGSALIQRAIVDQALGELGHQDRQRDAARDLLQVVGDALLLRRDQHEDLAPVRAAVIQQERAAPAGIFHHVLSIAGDDLAEFLSG